jgi:stress response protein YsnF
MSQRASPERLNIGESESVRIPLAAEHVRVGTRIRRTGVVRVSTRVERRTTVVDPPLRRQRMRSAGGASTASWTNFPTCVERGTP